MMQSERYMVGHDLPQGGWRDGCACGHTRSPRRRLGGWGAGADGCRWRHYHRPLAARWLRRLLHAAVRPPGEDGVTSQLRVNRWASDAEKNGMRLTQAGLYINLQARVVSGTALQQPVAPGADAAAAEAADRRRIMYEVQWQAASAAVPGTLRLSIGPHRQVAVLASQNRSGDLAQVPIELLCQQVPNTKRCMASCILPLCSRDIGSTCTRQTLTDSQLGQRRVSWCCRMCWRRPALLGQQRTWRLRRWLRCSNTWQRRQPACSCWASATPLQGSPCRRLSAGAASGQALCAPWQPCCAWRLSRRQRCTSALWRFQR